MKRFLSMLMILSLILCGCGAGESIVSEGDFFFYFPSEDPYDAQGFLTTRPELGEELPTLEKLIPLYLSAQIPEGAKELLPKGWELTAYELQNGGQLILSFAGAEAETIEISRTLACFTRTFSQLEEIRRIKLCPPGEAEPLVLSANDLLVEDMGMFPSEEVVLYVPNDDLRYLQRETFMVDSLTEEDKPEYILKRLLEGSDTGDAHSCIPSGTRLLGVKVENGVCTVDLSSEFAKNLSATYGVARLAVYSIVNSLTELDWIQTVDIHVAHSSMEQLCYMDLSGGLQRDETLMSGNRGYDGSVYPYAMDTELLVEVPVWIPEDPDKSVEEQLLEILLDYDSEHLLCHSIPEGTSVLSVRMAETTCVVDLTAEFMDRGENARAKELAVYSIVATLSTLPYVDAVEILVEGNRPQYESDLLRDVRTVEQEWFAPEER